jgi:hypothetical protein
MSGDGEYSDEDAEPLPDFGLNPGDRDYEQDYQDMEDDFEEYEAFDYLFAPVTRWQHIQIWFWVIVRQLKPYVKRCPTCHRSEKNCNCFDDIPF